MTTLENCENATLTGCHKVSDLSSGFTSKFSRNLSQTTTHVCLCEEKTSTFWKHWVLQYVFDAAVCHLRWCILNKILELCMTSKVSTTKYNVVISTIGSVSSSSWMYWVCKWFNPCWYYSIVPPISNTIKQQFCPDYLSKRSIQMHKIDELLVTLRLNTRPQWNEGKG